MSPRSFIIKKVISTWVVSGKGGDIRWRDESFSIEKVTLRLACVTVDSHHPVVSAILRIQ